MTLFIYSSTGETQNSFMLAPYLLTTSNTYMMVTEIFHFFIVPLKTTDVNGQTSLPTIFSEIRSKTLATSSTETDTPVYINITKVTGMTYRRTYPFVNLTDI